MVVAGHSAYAARTGADPRTRQPSAQFGQRRHHIVDGPDAVESEQRRDQVARRQMFAGVPARVKRGVGLRHRGPHLAGAGDLHARRGAGRCPGPASGVDDDAERSQPVVAVERAGAADTLVGHADVAQHAPGHVGVHGGLELEEYHQRPVGAVAVAHPPHRVAPAPRAVLDPLAGDVAQGREVEQRGDLREEAA